MHDAVRTTLGIAALAGVAAMVLARRLRIPPILLLLAAGAALGQSGLGVVNTSEIGRGVDFLLEFAVAVIIFEGAITLDPAQFKRSAGPIRYLVTIGALVSFVGASAVALMALDFKLAHALVFGSILIVTGPTVVAPLLAHVRPKPELAEILRWEATLLDPIGALVAVIVLEAVILGAGSGTAAAAAQRFFVSSAAGLGIGVGAGLVFEVLLSREDLIDAELRGPLALACAFGSYMVAEKLVPGSGLFSVTAAGLTLAMRRPPGIQQLEQWKGRLFSFLLGVLFVLLAGLLDLRRVGTIGREAFFVLGGLFLARFLGVLSATAGSGLSRREKLFLAWVSPRGVVAAALGSFFANRLAEQGDPQAAEIRTSVFAVIFGTVLVQGITARSVARFLGVLAREANEVVIVGAGHFGRALATELASAGSLVTVIDKNPSKLIALAAPGLRTISGDAQAKRVVETFDPRSLCLVVAATPNDEANALVCSAFSAAGAGNVVTQLPSGATAANREEDYALTRYPFTFGPGLTLERLEKGLQKATRLRRIPVLRATSLKALLQETGPVFQPLVEVGKGGAVQALSRPDAQVGPAATVIGLQDANVRVPSSIELIPRKGAALEIALALAVLLVAVLPFALSFEADLTAREKQTLAASRLGDVAEVRSFFLARESAPSYRPLARTALAIEGRFLEANVLASRVAGVLAIALAVGAAYLVALRVGLDALPAAASAAVFGMAPAHAWLGSIGARGDLLGMTFVLMALAVHATRGGTLDAIRSLGAAFLFLLGLLASNVALPFLVLAPFVDLARGERFEPLRLLRKEALYLLVALVYLALRWNALGGEIASAAFSGEAVDARDRAVDFATILARSVGGLFLPLPGLVEGPSVLASALRQEEILGAGVAAVIIILAVIARERVAWLGVALLGLGALPVLNPFSCAPLRSALALMPLGSGLLLGVLLERFGRVSRLGAVLAALGVVGAYFVATSLVVVRM